MAEAGWKWYLTPSIGNMGGAVEVEEVDTPLMRKVRRVAMVILGPQGEVVLMPWVPLKVSMCDQQGWLSVDSLALFEASDHAIRALNDLWNGEKSRIIRPPANGFPRMA